jgi:hypothetical protein
MEVNKQAIGRLKDLKFIVINFRLALLQAHSIILHGLDRRGLGLQKRIDRRGLHKAPNKRRAVHNHLVEE